MSELIAKIAYIAYTQAKAQGFLLTEMNAAEAVTRQLRGVSLDENAVFNESQVVKCNEVITTNAEGKLCRTLSFRFSIATYMVSKHEMILLDGRLKSYSMDESKHQLLDTVMLYYPDDTTNRLTISYGDLSGYKSTKHSVSNPIYIRPNDLYVISYDFDATGIKARFCTNEYVWPLDHTVYNIGNESSMPKRIHPSFDVYIPEKIERKFFGLLTTRVPDIERAATGFEFSFNKNDRKYVYSFSDNLSTEIIDLIIDNSTTFNPTKVHALPSC